MTINNEHRASVLITDQQADFKAQRNFQHKGWFEFSVIASFGEIIQANSNGPL